MDSKFKLININHRPRGNTSVAMNIAITPARIAFSTPLYRALTQPQFVQFYAQGSQVLIKPCKVTDPCAMRVIRLSTSGGIASREMASYLLKMTKKPFDTTAHVDVIALSDDGALFDMTKAY